MNNLDASIQDCSRVLRQYSTDYRPLADGLREAPGGFSGAKVWRIETQRGSCCLRRTDAQSLEPARLSGLHRLLRHIHAAGVEQVAVPIGTSDGASWVADGPFCWQLEPWMPGRADFDQQPSRRRLDAAMECLARWHAAAAMFVPNGTESRWFFQRVAPSPGISERLTLIEGWDQATRNIVRSKLLTLDWPEFREIGKQVLDLFERLSAGVENQLLVASRLPVPLQPCLRDIWHDHVLFTGDRVTGLIDPFACRSEHVATDLARLLGSLLRDDCREWEDALEAYRQLHPLDADDRGLIEVFDASGTLLAGMTWLDWICLGEREIVERPRVLSRLGTIVHRTEALLRRRRV